MVSQSQVSGSDSPMQKKLLVIGQQHQKQHHAYENDAKC